jgi:hypothetical protein
MSGATATDLLRNRFDEIREAELSRLSKKLRGLAPDHRLDVEAIAADVIRAIALVPERAIQTGVAQEDVDALARLFSLEIAANG